MSKNNDLFNKQEQKRKEKQSRRMHLSEGSGLYFLKSVLYSKTKKIVERPRRNIIPKIQIVKESWGQKESEKFDYNIAIKEAIRQENRKHAIEGKLSKLIVIASIVFSVFAVFYAVFLFLSERVVVSPDNIDIQVVAPTSVSSGDIFQMQVSIINKNQKALELADLVIRYPEGTKSPIDTKNDMTIQRLSLGTIGPNQIKKGTVRAVLFSPKDNIEKIKISLEYRPEGESYPASVVSYHSVRINSNAVDIAIDADKEAIQNQDILLTIKLTSNSDVPIYNAYLIAQYPFGFKPKAYSETPIQGNNKWLIKQLNPGEVKQIKIQGKMSGQDLDEKTFVFKVGFAKDNNEEDVELSALIAELSRVVRIKKPFISMDFAIDDAALDEQDKFFVVNVNKNYTARINWKNNLDVKLDNVIFAATIYGNAVDPFEVFPDAGFYDSNNNVIIWNKDTTKGALKEISSKQEGKLSFRFKPLSKEDLLDKNEPRINISLNVGARRISENNVREALESVKNIEVRVNSDIDLKTELLYNENPFVSEGPIPPIINQKTTYAIRWSIKNTTNKLKDVKVTATLPIYVKYLDLKIPATDTLIYNKVENTITWYVGDVEPKTGYDDDKQKQITFGISFTPSASQYGKVPNLLLNQKIEATDTFTKQRLTKDVGNLSATLTEDQAPEGSGRVR